MYKPDHGSSPFDWSKLGSTAPEALVDARILAHHAVQWATRSARANLQAAPDDSHTSLDWDAKLAALLSRPLPTAAGPLRVGIQIPGIRLVAVRAVAVVDGFSLDGKTDEAAGAWVDSALAECGLKPATGVSLPYRIPDPEGALYEVRANAGALAELSRWFECASAVLEFVRAGLGDLRARASPVRCWPHHFDIATLVALGDSSAEPARSIGIGVSPGDEFHAQPYVYVSPWPRFDAAALPALPRPGQWQTQGYFGAVATARQILGLADRESELLAFILGAIEIGRARLGA